MSTNKTPNYQLHSWLPDDEFHLTEINENFTKLDTKLHQEAARLQTALDTKTQVLAGTYTGTGGDSTVRVTLGVKPKAIIVMMYPTYSTTTVRWAVAAPGSNFQDSFVLDSTGFTVQHNGNSLIDLNNTGSVYHYIAFC